MNRRFTTWIVITASVTAFSGGCTPQPQEEGPALWPEIEKALLDAVREFE